jgi:hypothetical protein
MPTTGLTNVGLRVALGLSKGFLLLAVGCGAPSAKAPTSTQPPSSAYAPVTAVTEDEEDPTGESREPIAIRKAGEPVAATPASRPEPDRAKIDRLKTQAKARPASADAPAAGAPADRAGSLDTKGPSSGVAVRLDALEAQRAKLIEDNARRDRERRAGCPRPTADQEYDLQELKARDDRLVHDIDQRIVELGPGPVSELQSRLIAQLKREIERYDEGELAFSRNVARIREVSRELCSLRLIRPGPAERAAHFDRIKNLEDELALLQADVNARPDARRSDQEHIEEIRRRIRVCQGR